MNYEMNSEMKNANSKKKERLITAVACAAVAGLVIYNYKSAYKSGLNYGLELESICVADAIKTGFGENADLIIKGINKAIEKNRRK